MGTIVAQAIGILATPFLTRMFTPSDFGLAAIYGAVVAIFATLITLRYEIRVLLPDTEDEAADIVNLVVFLSLALGGTLMALAFFIPHSALTRIGLSDLGGWFTVAIGASVATAIIGVMTNWLNRQSSYRTLAGLRVSQSVTNASCALCAGFLSVQDGLIVAQFVAVIMILPFYFAVGKRKFFNWTSKLTLVETAKKHAKAPTYLLPVALVDIVTAQLPIILIALWFSSEEAGQFRIATLLLSIPGSMVGGAVSQIFFQRFSAEWPDAISSRRLLFTTWKLLALLGLVPLLFVLLFGEQLFANILGEEWSGSGVFASVLAPMVFAKLIHSPTSTTFVVMGSEEVVFILSFAVLLCRPISLYIGFCCDSVMIGLALFVACEIFTIIVFQLLAIRKINRLCKETSV